MAKVLVGIVVATLGAALVAAQSADTSWPPPGVVTQITPGVVGPQPISQVQPQYTADAIRRRLQGVVTVACVIEPDGSVGPVRVVQSLDISSGLDDQAIAAVKQMKFKPGTKGGAPVRVLASVNVIFSIKGVPPPSTWPALLTNEKASAVDVSQWREEVIQAERVIVRVRYPPDWTVRHGTAPRPLATIQGPDGTESVAVTPPLALPGPTPLPMPLAQLQFYSDNMRRSAGGLALDSLGIGQALSGSNWWVWQELHAPTSHFDRLAIDLQQPELAAFTGSRLWHFTTIKGNEMIIVFVNRLILSGRTPEMVDTDLRAAGVIFDQILRRISVENR